MFWCTEPVLEGWFPLCQAPDRSANVSTVAVFSWSILVPPHLFMEPRTEVGYMTTEQYLRKSHCGVHRSSLGARASLGHWNEHACCCNTSCMAMLSVLALLPSPLTNAVGTSQAKVSGFLFKCSFFLTLWIKEAKEMHSILGSKIRWCCAAGAL